MARRVDGVLLCGLGACAGPGLALAPAAASCAALGVAAIVVGTGRRQASHVPARTHAVVMLALCLMAAGGFRSMRALEAAGARYAATVAALPAPARCVLKGTVASSPVVLGTAAPPGDAPVTTTRVDLDVDGGECQRASGAELGEDGEPPVAPLVGGLRVRLYGAPTALGRGDVVEGVAQIAPVHLFWNEGLADPRAAVHATRVTASGMLLDLAVVARGRGLGTAIDRARAAVRSRIDATFPPATAPLARALVLGETALEPGDAEAFRASGLSHLLAVSGTHLVLVVVAFGRALRALLARVPRLAAGGDVGRVSALACVPLAWLYADFAGGSGSAVRAAAMLTVGMLARALGARPSGVRSFGWSLVGCALFDPLAMCDLSFALSVGATAGLLLGARLGDRSRATAVGKARGALATALHRAARAIGQLFAATLFAMLGCAPFILLIAPGLPLLSVAANVLAAPVGELGALPLCLLHALVAPWPAAEQGLALVGSGALAIVRAIAHAAGDGPALQLPPPTAAQIAALAMATASFLCCARGWGRRLATAAGLLALLVLEWSARAEWRTDGVLRVTALDVGQGDSLLVDLPDGKLMLVDGGGFVGSPVDPGLRVLLPVLRSRRRSRVDVVVVTHPHPDHYGGLLQALDALEVGEVWENGQASSAGQGALADLLARLQARGVVLRTPRELCRGPRTFGGATIELLAPCPSFSEERGANDNSLVLRISLGRRTALLVGDAEGEEERLLLSRAPAELRADLLKVGHHGSRTSSSAAFVATVDASDAFVSCGVRNRFGHPHPETLATLLAAGLVLHRTDRGGSVRWETDGEQVRTVQIGRF